VLPSTSKLHLLYFVLILLIVGHLAVNIDVDGHKVVVLVGSNSAVVDVKVRFVHFTVL